MRALFALANPQVRSSFATVGLVVEACDGLPVLECDSYTFCLQTGGGYTYPVQAFYILSLLDHLVVSCVAVLFVIITFLCPVLQRTEHALIDIGTHSEPLQGGTYCCHTSRSMAIQREYSYVCAPPIRLGRGSSCARPIRAAKLCDV